MAVAAGSRPTAESRVAEIPTGNSAVDCRIGGGSWPSAAAVTGGRAESRMILIDLSKTHRVGEYSLHNTPSHPLSLPRFLFFIFYFWVLVRNSHCF